MIIAICCNDNYATAAQVCLVSLFESNKGHNIHVYVLTSGLTTKHRKQFEEVASCYHSIIEIHVISPESYHDAPNFVKYISIETYYRISLADIIADDKVLYLDVDTMIRKDLDELWNTDISNYACAVIEDHNGDDVQIHNRLEIHPPYFNAGVMLINLKYWRENNIQAKVKEYLKKNKERCLFQDQDALNVILTGKVLFIDYKYNFQQSWLRANRKFRLSRDKWGMIAKASKDPVIMHYLTDLKPWNEGSNCPLLDEYLHYAKLHPFIRFRIKKQSLLSKFLYYLIRVLIGIYWRMPSHY